MPLLSALPPPALIVGCATPPHGKVLVRGGIDTLDIRPTVDMAQLDRMAKETGAGGAHRAYGFYFGAVAYTVTANIANSAQDACQGPIAVNVTMRLTNRYIGISRDIPAGSCRFTKITAHYRHHAEADEAVFQRYVLKVTSVLSATGPASLIAGPDDTPGRIAAAVNAVIEPVLTSMDEARSTARKAVDTPDEVGKLEAPCNQGL
jgi:hypothetical protein